MRSALKDPAIVYRRRWLTLLVLCISLVVIVLDNTILNVALPTMAHPVSEGGLGATASQLQWIVDSYTLVFAGLLLTAGSLGDRFGRYRFLAIGLSIFGLGSLMSAMAGSATTLIFTRSLMGIGAAFIMPATLSIITNVFTDPRERGKAIGIWAGVSALGVGIGPITGGLLLEHFWWGSVFMVNVPIVIAGLILGYFLIPESKDPSHAALDPLGAVLSIGALGTILWAVIEAPSKGWTSTTIVTAFAVGFVILGAFFAWELHSTHPMLDMRFFENPRFSAASGAITLVFLAMFGSLFLMTQYLQGVLGYSTVKAGAVLIPQAVTMMILAPMSPIWVRRFGNKLVVAAGLTIVALSFILFSTFQPNSSTLHIILVMMLMAVGMSHVMAPCTDSIMGSLPRAKAGVGSAVNDTTRQMGGAIGVAVFGSLMASHFTTLDGRQARLGAARRAGRSGEGQHQLSARHRGEDARCAALPCADRRRGERQLRQRPAHHRPPRGGHHAPRCRRRAHLPAGSRSGRGRRERLRGRARAGARGGGRMTLSDAEVLGEAEVRPRSGRPRDPACDEAILRATREAFTESGYAGVSVEGIAARAGVGKATIYRRYSTKAHLVVEAIRDSAVVEDHLPDTGRPPRRPHHDDEAARRSPPGRQREAAHDVRDGADAPSRPRRGVQPVGDRAEARAHAALGRGRGRAGRAASRR